MALISQGEFFVLVYKDGLLSRLGHDLRLQLERFAVEVDEDRVVGRFACDSLHVDTAMRAGVPRPGALSDKDREEIETTIAKRILLVSTHPEIQFHGSLAADRGDCLAVRGMLTILGRTQPISLDVRRRSGLLEGAMTLVPSRWGIKPFKALMGALCIQDRVDVRFRLTDGNA